MILYFTGTGNSLHVAGKISEETGDSLYSINNGIKGNSYPDLSEEKVLIFSVPTYAWRFPRVVEKWIDATDIFAGKRAYFFMSCGDGNGNAAEYLKKMCQRKNIYFMGCARILMPENYIALFNCPSEEKSVQIVSEADREISYLTPYIVKNQELPGTRASLGGKICSSVINSMFYTFYISSRKFRVSDACTGCGRCEDNCPLNNIHIIDRRPVWGDHCTHCMSCICGCPSEAVEYGRISRGKRRYRCPGDLESNNL